MISHEVLTHARGAFDGIITSACPIGSDCWSLDLSETRCKGRETERHRDRAREEEEREGRDRET